MKRRLAGDYRQWFSWVFSALIILVVTGCSSSNNSGASVQSLAVSPANVALVAGGTRQISAVATLSNDSSQTVTNFASWVSADPAVASVSNSGSNRGLITAVAAGTTTITASLQGETATVSVTVTDTAPTPAPTPTPPPATVESIEVSPLTASIAAGTQQAFTATAIYSNNTTQDVTSSVSWSSSDTAIATISNTAASKGLATGRSLGSATIRAVLNGVTGSATLDVTSAVATALAIAPRDASVPLNQDLQYTATATFSDNSTQDVTASATWASDTTSVATISNEAATAGLVTPVAEGMTTISADFQGISDSTGLTVGPAITLDEVVITPASVSIPNGTERQFTAEAVYSDASVRDVTAEVEWVSVDETIATISNDAGTEGLATAVNPGGPIDIEATFEGVTGTAALTVTAAVLESISIEPVNASVAVGNTQQFSATGLYSDDSTADLTDTVVWSSSDSAIVSISNGAGSQGLAGANAVGMVTITAEAGDVSGTTGFTVTDATLQALQIEPANAQLANGFELQYTARGIYSDGSNRDITGDVTWVSTNQALATVSNVLASKGRVTADQANVGGLQIQASIGQQLASTGLTVTNATLNSLLIGPADEKLPLGSQLQYVATGTFSDASTQDLTDQVTWASSDTTKARIVQSGVATAVAVSTPGTVDITAEHAPSGINDQTTLEVTDATVVSMTISPQSDSIAKGRTRSFKATGVFSDNTSRDITTQVAWSTSDMAIATISNAAGSEGQATAVDVGDVDIMASITNSQMDLIEADAALTVTDAVLDAVDVTPATVTVAKGTQQQFTATATYSDGTNPDVTSDVTWSSSNGNVATISNAAGNEGLASTVAAGNTLITAQFGGKTDSAALTVTAAAITQIDIEPLDPTMPKGTSLNFTATATFTDATTQDVTTQVTWASSDTGVADVSNASGTKGRVTATASAGTADITATLSGITGTSQVTASNAELQSIVVTPVNATIEVGDNQQYEAQGIYTDGTTQSITNAVTWTSTDISVATIVPTTGAATGVGAGNTLIVATDPVSSIQGSTSLIVIDPAP